MSDVSKHCVRFPGLRPRNDGRCLLPHSPCCGDCLSSPSGMRTQISPGDAQADRMESSRRARRRSRMVTVAVLVEHGSSIGEDRDRWCLAPSERESLCHCQAA
jgi:hypothetical protein